MSKNTNELKTGSPERFRLEVSGLVSQWKLKSSVMRTPIQPLTWLVVVIAGWVQRDQQAAIVYLLEKNRVLKARLRGALLHGPEQIADLPVPVAESPGAVRIGHPERSHLVEYLAPNSVFNSLPRQRSSPHLRPDDRLVTIDRVLHHASLGVA